MKYRNTPNGCKNQTRLIYAKQLSPLSGVQRNDCRDRYLVPKMWRWAKQGAEGRANWVPSCACLLYFLRLRHKSAVFHLIVAVAYWFRRVFSADFGPVNILRIIIPNALARCPVPNFCLDFRADAIITKNAVFPGSLCA